MAINNQIVVAKLKKIIHAMSSNNAQEYMRALSEFYLYFAQYDTDQQNQVKKFSISNVKEHINLQEELVHLSISNNSLQMGIHINEHLQNFSRVADRINNSFSSHYIKTIANISEFLITDIKQNSTNLPQTNNYYEKEVTLVLQEKLEQVNQLFEEITYDNPESDDNLNDNNKKDLNSYYFAYFIPTVIPMNSIYKKINPQLIMLVRWVKELLEKLNQKESIKKSEMYTVLIEQLLLINTKIKNIFCLSQNEQDNKISEIKDQLLRTQFSIETGCPQKCLSILNNYATNSKDQANKIFETYKIISETKEEFSRELKRIENKRSVVRAEQKKLLESGQDVMTKLTERLIAVMDQTPTKKQETLEVVKVTANMKICSMRRIAEEQGHPSRFKRFLDKIGETFASLLKRPSYTKFRSTLTNILTSKVEKSDDAQCFEAMIKDNILIIDKKIKKVNTQKHHRNGVKFFQWFSTKNETEIALQNLKQNLPQQFANFLKDSAGNHENRDLIIKDFNTHISDEINKIFREDTGHCPSV